MTRSIHEIHAESFIYQFMDKEKKRIIKGMPATIEEIQENFTRTIRKMRPGDVRVFQEIQISSIPKKNVSSRVNVSASLIQFCKSRCLDDYQKNSIYGHIQDVYNTKNLRYDFLVCKMDASGNLQMTAIEVNGPQHYFGTGSKFASQITRDIAKMIASRNLGIKFIEIDASNGISPAGYELIEKELKKFGVKRA